MAKLLTLPKLSVVMKEGKIINWYFNEGDKIKKGDVLYDVEAGKMGGSAESEDEGTILKILANIGDKLKCGEPVAIIGEPGESFEELIPVKAEETEETAEKTTVAVIGGGNTAAEDALYLSKLCKKVYLIHRRSSLRASVSYQKQLEMAENVEILWNSVPSEFIFDNIIKGIKLKDTVSKNEYLIDCDGIFIAIGRTPNTALVKGQLELDESGYIISDETTKTNIPGVFAAGDIRTKPLRQIVTAASDGAVASKFAEEYISELN